jgi:hypothetical protein
MLTRQKLGNNVAFTHFKTMLGLEGKRTSFQQTSIHRRSSIFWDQNVNIQGLVRINLCEDLHEPLKHKKVLS